MVEAADKHTLALPGEVQRLHRIMIDESLSSPGLFPVEKG
jgi:hypothetical protein